MTDAMISRPNWTPVRHTVFRDDDSAQCIHDEGYTVMRLLSDAQLDELQVLADREHRIQPVQGGMFYSVYSQDLAYRRRVHEEIHAVLKPTLDGLFTNYRNVLNMFVVKASGPASEFGIHQDSTALDEFAHSPLSLWIPLCDVDERNGAMCLVPRSHGFFSPYRGVSFPFPFASIQSTVREYLQPLPMRRGEVLVFDNRLVHSSLSNLSGDRRDAIVAGIFPSAARFQTCFKAPGRADAPTELFVHDDAWLMTYPNFLQNCHERPVSGQVVGHAKFDFAAMDEAEFRSLCAQKGVAPSHRMPPAADLRCNMIAEPVM